MSKCVEWVDRALVVSPYYIGLCKSPDVFERELKRMKVPKANRPAFILNGSGATVHFFEKGDGKLCAIVCITKPKGMNRIQLDCLLVHEAAHIWQAIRDNIGEKSPSHEFEAYAIQSISQRLIESYWAKPTKAKKGQK
ncbi:MAG: hypothetical protein WA085_12635 [Sphingobium sp.]